MLEQAKREGSLKGSPNSKPSTPVQSMVSGDSLYFPQTRAASEPANASGDVIKFQLILLMFKCERRMSDGYVMFYLFVCLSVSLFYLCVCECFLRG
jgi:hypothetical protein